MLYRITLAVDVEAGNINDAAAAAAKAVAEARQRGGIADGGHVTRCEVTEAKRV